MPMSIFIPFRGKETEVTIDKVIEDPSVNYYEIQWHFTGLSNEQHRLLKMTDVEEQAILEACWKAVDDERRNDD